MNNSSSSYSSNITSCNTLINVLSLKQFFDCLVKLIRLNDVSTFVQLFFGLATVIANLVLFIKIHKNHREKNIFDRIFCNHAIADCVVGLVVMPFYTIYYIFGYWPLGRTGCMIYVSFDYTLTHVGIMHILYLSYVRMRTLRSPKQYMNEVLIKNYPILLALLWVTSGMLWLPAINLITVNNYEERSCYFTFHLYYIILQCTIAYVTPMCVIMCFTCMMLFSLHQKKQRGKQYATRVFSGSLTPEKNNKESMFGKLLNFRKSIGSSEKLIIIIGFFLVLWFPFSVSWIIISVCESCVHQGFYMFTYWCTYAQSLVNPLLILILNPRISPPKK